LRAEVRCRCDHIQSITLAGLAVVRFGIGRSVEGQLNLGDRVIGPSFNCLDPRSEVIDYIVLSDDVCDVSCLTDDLNISLRSLDVARVIWLPPVSQTNKSVGSRPDVIVRIRP
jgi:hypothetical protein